MFNRLPDPDRTLLRAAPVNLVVFTLNYDAALPWVPQAGIRWRDALSAQGITGKLLGANQHQMNVTPGMPTESRTRRGFQVSQDNGVTATLYEDSVVLEARQYAGWPLHRDLIQKLLTTANEQRQIVVESSLALRYVNALSDEEARTAAFWHDKVNAAFLGPASDSDLLDDFKRGLYLLTFNDGALNAEVRVGVQPDAVFPNCVAFVFDLEFTDAEQREFRVDEALARADELNTAALKGFQRILAPQYLRELANA